MTNETTAPELISKARDGSMSRDEFFAIADELCRDLADVLEAAQARIAELEGALRLVEHAARWSPTHPDCKKVIRTVGTDREERTDE
jgi:hypothetical protein